MPFLAAHQHAFGGKIPHVHQFILMPTATPAVGIHVLASVYHKQLQLSYFIQDQNTPWHDFVGLTRADYLWEKTCLECFFDVGQNGYLELNFCPTGEYNLYRFDDYRTPNTLPPTWANGKIDTVQGLAVKGYHTHHLMVQSDDIDITTIKKINPTAILYHDGKPNFYAVQHANPPDFHDKAFWQAF